jgi:hypothetical protein
MLASGALAAAIGAISLRTRGVYFIMITLAFAQMLYYVFVSLKAFGGDDGMSLAKRSRFAGLDLGSDVTFYYVVLALFAAALLFLGRLGDSRFGVVLRGIEDNELRMESLGFATYRFKLAAFVIAGALAGLAGALMANQNGFVFEDERHGHGDLEPSSPEQLEQPERSPPPGSECRDQHGTVENHSHHDIVSQVIPRSRVSRGRAVAAQQHGLRADPPALTLPPESVGCSALGRGAVYLRVARWQSCATRSRTRPRVGSDPGRQAGR